MMYVVIMSDRRKDERIVKKVDVNSVFDAIDAAAELIESPEDTELIEAFPMDVT